MSEWWHRWLYPIRLLIPRNRRDAEEDLDAEVGAHLEIETQENSEAGMPPDEARFAARRTFGNVGLFKEDARESWGVGRWCNATRILVRRWFNKSVDSASTEPRFFDLGRSSPSGRREARKSGELRGGSSATLFAGSASRGGLSVERRRGGVLLEPVRSIDALGGEVPPGFIQLFSALGLVLLVACTNIAAVMVARGSARQKETAIRAALGAGHCRLIRQLLTESFLLAGLGGAVGLLFTYWGIDLIAYFAPGDWSRSVALDVDVSVFAFALLISVLTGLLSGIAPALADSRVDVNKMLKEGGESQARGAPRQRLRNLLVVAEVALTLMLLVGVGLLIKSFVFVKGMDPGFDQDQLMTFRIELPESENRLALLFDDILRRLGELPEVGAATLIATVAMVASYIPARRAIKVDPVTALRYE